MEFLYSLSGALNVLLFLTTRSKLFLPRKRLGMAPGGGANGINLHLLQHGSQVVPGSSSTVGQTVLQPESQPLTEMNGTAVEQGALDTGSHID